MLNLRALADVAGERSLEFDEINSLKKAADVAETMAFDVDSLVDGKDDELADLLAPVVAFLKGLAGINPGSSAS